MEFLTALLFLATAQAPVEVPFRIGETSLIVDAVVNGKPVSVMFDTGFGGCVDLSNTINVGEPTGKITLRDFVGEMEADTVKVKSLKLGSQTIDSNGMEAVLSRPEDYSFVFGTHCDGIMGLEVIKNNITEINFEHQKFIFYPPSTDISKRTPDNKKTFLTKMLPIGTNSIELSVGTPTGKFLHMALDTGNSFYATTHRDSLERVGLWETGKDPKYTTMAGVASGPVVSWDKKMTGMNIFGVPVPESTWDVIDLPSSSAGMDGTVGFGFLKNFNIVIDYGRRRVWLENWTGKVDNDPPGQLGISAAYDNEERKVKVFAVAPGSPAEEAGLKEGDEILSVDTYDLAGVISSKKLKKLLSGAKGTKVKLAISRTGSLKRFEIERKALVNE
jgi:hypothetical protein